MRRVAAIAKRLDEIHATGAEVVLVGVGTPEQAGAFRLLTGWKGPLLTDPERRAYAAADLRKLSVWRLLRPSFFRSARTARQEGFRQTKTKGDPWQLGGTLVLAPGGRVLLVWRNANPDDEAPLDDVVAALRPVGGASPGDRPGLGA